MDKALTIVIAPNEDGLGTSAWAVRLVRELFRQAGERISKIKIPVATDKRYEFHQDKYPPGLPVDIIRLRDITNRIELAKKAGSVDVRRSIEQAILPYARSRVEYAAALTKQNVLESADLVIDLGVPQLVRAVHHHNLSRTMRSERPINSITVFDHAWSLSLRKMAFSEAMPEALAQVVEEALIDIENDEALTPEAIIFGEPLSPLDYHGHWRKLLGHFPRVIPGTLGGPLSTLEFAGDPEAARLRVEMKRDGHCPPEAYSRARQQARRLLGIENDLPTLFVSGAGTSVWDEVLQGMMDDYERNQPDYNVVVYSPAEASRRGVHLAYHNGIERGRHPKTERLTFINRTAGETHHILCPAFDLMLTRAGGGTVNDALANGVPLVLVEEPGMWQVEQIRQACLSMGIAEGATLKDLRESPRACVESADGGLRKLEKQRERILAIPNHGETWLGQELLKLAQSGAGKRSRDAPVGLRKT